MYKVSPDLITYALRRRKVSFKLAETPEDSLVNSVWKKKKSTGFETSAFFGGDTRI